MRVRWAGLALAVGMAATGTSMAAGPGSREDSDWAAPLDYGGKGDFGGWNGFQGQGGWRIVGKSPLKNKEGSGFIFTQRSMDPNDQQETIGRAICKPSKGRKPNIFWLYESGAQLDTIIPGNEENEPNYIQGSYDVWYVVCGVRRR